MPSDFYELLEVPPDADETAIDAAFREKAREYHPDRNDHEQATEQFQVLKKAHEVLSDPDSRSAYDRLGHDQYVANSLGGLPGIDVVTSSGDGRQSQADGQPVAGTNATAQPAESASRTNGGGRGGSAAASSGRRRRRRYYRTTPGSPPGPGRIANGLWVLGAVCYSGGVGVFLDTNRSAVEALVGGVVASESLLTGLTSPAISLSRWSAFTATAVAEGSLGVAFPIGAILLALAGLLAARRIQDPVAWCVGGVSLGPLLGFGLAWLSSAGLLMLPPAVANAAATVLVFFVVAPLVTAGGWLWLAARGRRL